MYIVDIFRKNKFSSIIKLDDEEFFKINNKELKKYKFNIDDEINEEDMEKLKEIFIIPAIKHKLSDLLSKKDYSYKELFDKIYRYGYSRKFSEPILNMFIDKKYIDDYNYCESLIYSYSKRYGINKIKKKLYEKGINSSIYNEVLEDMDIDFVEVLKDKLSNEDLSDLSDYNKKNKLVRKYISKGYTYDELDEALYNLR